MVRLCLCIFILLDVMFSEQANNQAITSPVLKRNNRRNYLSFNDKTYFFGTIFKANYFSALQFCRQQGMHLVSITSHDENERIGHFIKDIGAQDKQFWTSGTNFIEEYQFVWMSTGNYLVYTNWDVGQPSLKNSAGVTENCIDVGFHEAGFTWNDADCGLKLYFICEAYENCPQK
ncbi:hypothetical protein NQ318_012966 [Aromia moschata]|uniref:C-type lectin domain-containing protein n=1 Tax=Aromia moschata TaxID=1265417 RepID=A0AAV8XPZ6_9CUCU|nr:hypothetical protein NQ318_012966 [Aromia moschata]